MRARRGRQPSGAMSLHRPVVPPPPPASANTRSAAGVLTSGLPESATMPPAAAVAPRASHGVRPGAYPAAFRILRDPGSTCASAETPDNDPASVAAGCGTAILLGRPALPRIAW